MIIQVQRETGLANRTIIISERQVALFRVLGSRLGIVAATVFIATWLLFAIQSVRVPLLSGKIAELERDNRRIDSLQVALSRMHGRYEQVRQMLAATGGVTAKVDAPVATKVEVPNVDRRAADVPAASPTVHDTAGPTIR